jgi:hypothetical protein
MPRVCEVSILRCSVKIGWVPTSNGLPCHQEQPNCPTQKVESLPTSAVRGLLSNDMIRQSMSLMSQLRRAVCWRLHDYVKSVVDFSTACPCESTFTSYASSISAESLVLLKVGLPIYLPVKGVLPSVAEKCSRDEFVDESQLGPSTPSPYNT